MFEDIYIENGQTKMLDATYKAAKEKKIKSPCSIIYGLTGSGKTSITNSWLKHYGYKYVELDATSLKMTKFQIPDNSIPSLNEGVVMLDKDMMNELFKPKYKDVNVILSSGVIDNITEDTIVFIDNYDRAEPNVRLELFKFIKECKVVDIREESGIKKIHPFMFIIIIDSLGKNELSTEERQIFGI